MNKKILLFFFVTVEIATLTRKHGKTRINILPNSKVEALIKTYEAEEAKLAAEKKKESEKKKGSSSKWKSCSLTN